MTILRHSKRTWGKSYLCNSKWDKQLLLKASKAIFKSTYLSILKNERSENTWRGQGKNHNFAKRCKALHAQAEKENNLKWSVCHNVYKCPTSLNSESERNSAKSGKLRTMTKPVIDFLINISKQMSCSVWSWEGAFILLV